MRKPSRHIVTRACQVFTLIAGMGCAAAALSDSDESKQRHTAGKSINFVPNKSYQSECTSCHVGYLPGFLPERSWKELMTHLDDHFGENASLDEPIRTEIENYLVKNAADKPAASPRSKKMAKMLWSSDLPLRITETPFWKRKHYSVREYVWKRPNVGSKAKCDSCHHDANKGIFNERDIHIPK